MKQMVKITSLIMILLCFKNELVQSFNCFQPRFPITIGDETTGATEIKFIEVDSAGLIYFGGTTSVPDY